MAGDNITEALGLDDLGEVPESELVDANEEGGEFELEEGTDENDGADEEGNEPPAPTGRKQLVPLGALQEERTKRQAKEQELETLRQTQNQMQLRFNEMMMRLQGVQKEPPAPQEDVIPDFNEDPQGHVEGLKRQFAKQLDEVRQMTQQQQGLTQQQQHMQQLAQQATAAEAEFVKVKPDYMDAASFFQQRKIAEYQAFGLDPAAAAAQLAKDCTGIVQGALHRGANPAEVMYNLAHALGYAGKAATAPQGTRPKAKAPTSLANASGAGKAPDEDDGGALTLEKVGRMSDAEFDKFWKEQQKGSIQRPRY